MWAAACRRYDHREAEEVLRERFLTLAGTVTYEDYGLYRAPRPCGTTSWLQTDQSYRKLRQVLFRMMVEAGLLRPDRSIEPAPSIRPCRRVQ